MKSVFRVGHIVEQNYANGFGSGNPYIITKFFNRRGKKYVGMLCWHSMDDSSVQFSNRMPATFPVSVLKNYRLFKIQDKSFLLKSLIDGL
jgi:hypothetical protein